jgi:tetratricopeptide (TPR) repeat protein
MGILVMSGPGIKAAGRIHGASLLDLCPTILTLFGLPCGQDMPGKPLLDALEDAATPSRIPSWETVAGDDGRHPAGTKYHSGPSPDSETDAVTQQMAALGYIEDHATDKSKAAEAAQLEADYNLAQVHLCHDRPDDAVPLLERVLAVRPWESRYIHQLANALTRSGWHRQAVDLLLRAYPDGVAEPPPAPVLLVLARAHIGLGEGSDARRCLALAVGSLPAQPGPWLETGRLALSLANLEQAEHAFRRALVHDNTFAAAWQGLATIHLHRHENEPALEAALEAVSHIFQFGEAHLSAGIALARLGRYADARIAFERVTRMCPLQPHAWRFLAALPVEGENAALLREACRRQSVRFTREWALRQRDVRRRAREPRLLPDIPPPSVRRETIQRFRPLPVPPPAPGSSGRTFTLVSGLPRSGTSLMMQMLAAGGLAPKTDGLRPADEDNPDGYFEWEAIKRVGREHALFDDPGLDALAIKCVTPLLRQLPAVHRYRVIFMLRPVEEIAASQARMIDHRGSTGMEGDPAAIAARLLHHRDEILAFLRNASRVFDVLTIDYPRLVADPAPAVSSLASFLGPQLLPHPENMAAVIRPALYRNRRE